MTSSLRRQEGMGFLGIIAVLAVVGFIGLLGVRMVPIYLEANTVRGIVQGMQDDPAMRGPPTGRSASAWRASSKSTT